MEQFYTTLNPDDFNPKKLRNKKSFVSGLFSNYTKVFTPVVTYYTARSLFISDAKRNYLISGSFQWFAGVAVLSV